MPYSLKLMIDGLTGPDSGGLDVLTFDWGGVVETDARSSQGAKKVNMRDLTITRKGDKASSKLFSAMMTGTSLPSVHLGAFPVDAVGVAPSASSSQEPYLVITLRDVFISSMQVSGAEASDERPIETISFAYRKVDYAAS